MLLEIAIGDAYGAGFEFAPQAKVDCYNNVSKYMQHELGISAGHYTDDTQMSLAIAELLIEGKPWTRQNIADKFVECFKRDERQGYSKGFYYFLKSVNNGAEFLEKIEPNSERNGAAMRAAPLGYLQDITTLLEYAKIQAMLTHNTEIGIKSSQAVALAAHFAIYNLGEKRDLTAFVCQHTNFNWNDLWQQSVKCCGEQTVNAILSVLKSSESLKGVLTNSVAFTGDVDTVAAVALGIAKASNLYADDLPNFLYEEIEDGQYGKQYLLSQTRKISILRG